MDINVSRVIGFSMVTTAGAADTTTTPTCLIALGTGNYVACTNAPVRKTAGGNPTNGFHLTLTDAEFNSPLIMLLITGTGCVPISREIYPETNWIASVCTRVDAAISTRSSHTAADVKTAIEAAGSSLASIIAHLVGIKGGGWATESLVSIKSFIDSIYGKTQALPANPAAVGSAMTLQAGHGLALDSTVAKDATVSKLTAQQVWEYSTRSLSTFGTLISDIWGALTSALTTNGSIGKLLSGFVFTTPGKVDATADVAMSEQNINDIASGVVTAINGGGDVPYSNTVEYPAGTPIPGVEVHCCSDSLGQSVIASTITDDLGVFTFYLVPGNYYIAIQHPQFQGSLTAITVN